MQPDAVFGAADALAGLGQQQGAQRLVDGVRAGDDWKPAAGAGQRRKRVAGAVDGMLAAH